MWLSERKTGSEKFAGTGKITISGENAAVMAESEKRNTILCAPGGYFWKPDDNEDVVVFETADGTVIAGCCVPLCDLQPGEVTVFSKSGASITLKNDGDIYVNGNLHISGGVFTHGNEAG